ncbi:MAG: hypothetical protein NT092_03345 [Bacteroidia bacterium]|nr:hypothetical protein [Bacteroidia bacterium]
MRIVFSILLSMLISFSGIRINYSSHFCGGSEVASKVSLTGELATCGMEKPTDIKPSGIYIKNHCCEDITTSFSIYSNYTTENILSVEKENTKYIFIITPYYSQLTAGVIEFKSFPVIRPPGFCTNDVLLQSLCNLRI